MYKKMITILFFPIFLFSENLDELINISIKNRLIDSSVQNLNSIEENYNSTKKAYLPSLSINGRYSNVSEETISNPKNSISASASISYNAYDGGKKDLIYKSFETQIGSSKESIIYQKNQISLEVTSYYYNYLSYLAKKDAKQKEIEQLNAQYVRLERFLDAGVTTVDELDKIVSRVESANVELHEIELNLQTIIHNLEYILGKSVLIANGSKIKLVKDEKNIRADIKALELNMQNKLILAKQEKTAINPNVTLDNTYTYYENMYDNDNYDSNLDNQNVLSLNVSWKVFDFDSTKKAYESAYKSYLSSKSTYEYEKNRAEVDLKLAHKSYDIAKLKIKSAEAGLKAATSTYDFTLKKYENGIVDNVTFLEALSEKYDAISLLESAKYDLEVKKANVVFYSGKNLWEYVK
ncbi:TolC family protein [Arcobacter sp. LA11]|uniref:TolC family protein n=1 Tax=Arcobacter sp. LA11 TaxID=1898176 RepID=UPI000932EB6A|nr:TolC family protein [Arcobacter sp. LA11]